MPHSPSLLARVAALPPAPGVYLWKNASGETVYIGKAKDLRRRVSSYLKGSHAHPRTQALAGEISDLEWIGTPSEADALALEETLIRRHRPRYNVALVDEGGYPYLRITLEEDFPRVLVTRSALPTGSRYIGPFLDPSRLRALRAAIARAFHVRSCSYDLPRVRPSRPCLDFHIGRCLAPCVLRQSREDYRRMIDDVIAVAEGDTARLVERLASDMASASKSMNFELAARLRDQIAALEAPVTPTVTALSSPVSRDVVAVDRLGPDACVVWLRVRAGRVVDRRLRLVHVTPLDSDADILHAWIRDDWRHSSDRSSVLVVASRALAPDASALPGLKRVLFPARGPMRALVEMAAGNARAVLDEMALDTRSLPVVAEAASPPLIELKEALNLPVPPKTILCFDISHASGRHTVASMVAFVNGRPEKSMYRSFNIRTVDFIDDPASIGEAVGRFAARAAQEGFAPDLIVIDGGPTQLAAARTALDGAGMEAIRVVSLAKRQEEIYFPHSPDPLRLPRKSRALLLLQAIRDEAHRFALAKSRARRHRELKVSALDRIPGLGPQKRALLLRHFGSIEAIRSSSAEEIAHLPGFTVASGQRILRLLSAPGPAAPAALSV